MDVFNKIVKSSREKAPIHNHQTDLDFFRIKEQRYLKHLHKYQNDDGNYTISQPVAMALALAVETEQRNKHFIDAQNESQDDFEKFHLRNHVPRIISSYWAILNAPKMAAFQRCIPLRHYYDEIVQDSPGVQRISIPQTAIQAHATRRISNNFNSISGNRNHRFSSR